MAFATFPTFAAARNPAQVERIVVSIVSRFILDQLLDRQRRAEHYIYCKEGLINSSLMEDAMEALEEAIRTPLKEAKLAKLDIAQSVLQSCTKDSNPYLSSWAYMHLAYIWKMRKKDRQAAVHILDMFLVDSHSARLHFAPGLWDKLFSPHLTSINGWYALQRHRVRILDADVSFYSREDFSVQAELPLTSEQSEQLKELEKLYQDSLDVQTKDFARYYRDWLTYTADSPKRLAPLMPIAEPPMTPLHEVGTFHNNRAFDIVGSFSWKQENDVRVRSAIKSSSSSSSSQNVSPGATDNLSILLDVETKPEMLKEGNIIALSEKTHDIFISGPAAELSPYEASTMAIEQNVKENLNKENQLTLMQHQHGGVSDQNFEDIKPVLQSLETKSENEKMNAISILLRCMKENRPSKILISETVHLPSLLTLIHSTDINARTITIAFLMELGNFHRWSSKLGADIKSGTKGSSMHALLVHLQVAPFEHRPLTAALLLQLDLLGSPWDASIFREEALDALTEPLTSKDQNLLSQVEAACAIEATILPPPGYPTLASWLLTITKEQEQQSPPDHWYNVARTFLEYDEGYVIDVLAKHVLSTSSELALPCMTTVTWLLWMVRKLPDMGLITTAKKTLLPQLVTVLESSSGRQQKLLAACALYSLFKDSGTTQQLLHMGKRICLPLRELRHETWTAKKIIRMLANNSNTQAEIWNHKRVAEKTTSNSIRALACGKGRLYSGHANGTIQIWNINGDGRPVHSQEVQAHKKKVTSLAVVPTRDRLYSGSLDKTIRVWETCSNNIICIQTFDLKESVIGITVTGPLACIVLQGNGIKVQYEDTETKHINTRRGVQTVTVANDMIYCGCTDNSVQEMDSIGNAMVLVQGGQKRFLGKRPVYAVQVSNGNIFAGGSPVDGMAVKVWNQIDKSLVSALAIKSEVRCMAMDDEFIYFGLVTGAIEVWLRDRLVRVQTLNAGSKVNVLLLNGNQLYSGLEDGNLQVWR